MTATGSTKRKRTAVTDEVDSMSDVSFVCDRCAKRIHLEVAVVSMDAEEKVVALAALRLEHADFHFALDLSREGSLPAATPVQTKRGDKSEGIGRYFVKKRKTR